MAILKKLCLKPKQNEADNVSNPCTLVPTDFQLRRKMKFKFHFRFSFFFAL